MPNLVLIRHGQSQWNLENRFTGWKDVDLTEAGKQEAQAAGKTDQFFFHWKLYLKEDFFGGNFYCEYLLKF